MHQSTPLLPGFNVIRIDYIDFARGRNLRVVLAKLLTQRVNEPLHLMIFRIGRLLNRSLSREYRLSRAPDPRISIRDAMRVRDAFVMRFDVS